MRKRVVWHFEPGSFRPLARESVDDAGEARVHYVVTDHLGAPREVLAANGELAWAASYRLWGSLRQQWTKPRPVFKYSVNASLAFATTEEDEEDLCPIRFPGQWQDDETGLYYNRYRHYDPLAGQYVSPDPIGLEGGDRTQGYVENPLAWVDVLGLKKNLNSNKAQGNFGVYEVESIDNATGAVSTHKFGKADLDRVTESSGLPTRIHQQIRILNRDNPGKTFRAKILQKGIGTTKDAKTIEDQTIRDFYNKNGFVPPGNVKSFKP